MFMRLCLKPHFNFAKFKYQEADHTIGDIQGPKDIKNA
jgi:hypothetical protein